MKTPRKPAVRIQRTNRPLEIFVPFFQDRPELELGAAARALMDGRRVPVGDVALLNLELFDFRPGHALRIENIPHDLTAAEARKIARVLMAFAIPTHHEE